MSEPSYTLPVDVSFPSRPTPLVSGVTCKIFLPTRIASPVILQLFPRQDQASYFAGTPFCSIAGATVEAGGKGRTTIQADDIELHCSTKSWNSALAETICDGKPARLRILVNLPTSKLIGHFWLTPSVLLAPSKIVEASYTGSVKTRNVRMHRFLLPGGLRLTFDTHFRHESNDSGETITFQELVAEFRPRRRQWPTWDVLRAFNFIDEYLLLVSFAERRRCVCLGLDVAVPPQSLERYYRRDVAMPEANEGPWSGEPLISAADFAQFMNVAYGRLVEMNQASRDFMKQALARSLHRKSQVLEYSFMALYSALEMIVLSFRRTAGLEYVLPPAQFGKRLRGDLAAYVASHPVLAAQPRQRDWLCANLSALNRIPFAEAFHLFRQRYNVDVDDLWPVTLSDVPLSRIRNRLVHGEQMVGTQFAALAVAYCNLKWVVERSILAVLGWPSNQSSASRGRLAGDSIPYMTWKKHQAAFRK